MSKDEILWLKPNNPMDFTPYTKHLEKLLVNTLKQLGIQPRPEPYSGLYEIEAEIDARIQYLRYYGDDSVSKR